MENVTQRLVLAPLLGATVLAASLFVGTAAGAALEVQLSNLRPGSTLQVTVFDNADAWEEGRGMVAGRRVAVEGTTAVVQFCCLAPGRYAIRAEQEGEDDAPILAIAAPRRGFSRNPSLRGRGIPAFDRTAVVIDESALAVPLRLFLAEDWPLAALPGEDLPDGHSAVEAAAQP